MKKTFTIKREEQIEIEVQFPVYFKPNDYTCGCLVDEQTYLKISVIEKFRVRDTEPIVNSVWISMQHDRADVDNALVLLHSGKAEIISPEAFDTFYFEAKKLVQKQFNILDNNALPE